MAGKKAIVSINIVSDADNRGFRRAADAADGQADVDGRADALVE